MVLAALDLGEISFATLGPSGILAVIVLGVVFGRLVPRATVERADAKASETLEAARAEAAYWRETCTVQFQAHIERERAQDEALREAAITWRTLLRVAPGIDAPP